MPGEMQARRGARGVGRAERMGGAGRAGCDHRLWGEMRAFRATGPCLDLGGGGDFGENPGFGAREHGHQPIMGAAIGMGAREIRDIGKQPLQQRHHQTHDRQCGREAGLVARGGRG